MDVNESQYHFLILMMPFSELLLLFEFLGDLFGSPEVFCNFLLLIDIFVLVVCVFNFHDLSDMKVIVSLMLFGLLLVYSHEGSGTIAPH